MMSRDCYTNSKRSSRREFAQAAHLHCKGAGRTGSRSITTPHRVGMLSGRAMRCSAGHTVNPGTLRTGMLRFLFANNVYPRLARAIKLRHALEHAQRLLTCTSRRARLRIAVPTCCMPSSLFSLAARRHRLKWFGSGRQGHRHDNSNNVCVISWCCNICRRTSRDKDQHLLPRRTWHKMTLGEHFALGASRIHSGI
jgi:hypothetical protein